MTEYTVRSLVIICPVDQIDAVDQMAESIGYKAGFSIPLSADGTGEPTHKGLHATARKHFLWLVTGQPDEVPSVTPAPAPLTEEQYEAVSEAEAALVYPDPESETFEADKASYHTQLTTIRKPVNDYNAGMRRNQQEQAEANAITLARSNYDAINSALLESATEEEINAIRSSLIVSSDPVVDDVSLYGSAHVNHVASANNLQVIESSDAP